MNSICCNIHVCICMCVQCVCVFAGKNKDEIMNLEGVHGGGGGEFVVEG